MFFPSSWRIFGLMRLILRSKYGTPIADELQWHIIEMWVITYVITTYPQYFVPYFDLPTYLFTYLPYTPPAVNIHIAQRSFPKQSKYSMREATITGTLKASAFPAFLFPLGWWIFWGNFPSCHGGVVVSLPSAFVWAYLHDSTGEF